MAITLRDITNRMISAYRKADYAPAGVHNVEIDSWRGTKALLFTADVDGSKGGTYDVGVEFFQVNFSDEQKPGWIPVESEGGTIYAEVPTMSYNNCALKCSCPDFQYRFEKELYDVGSTIGNWRRYKKVVGSTRGPVNPKGIPGFCFAGDTLIPLADGVSSPIKDLVGMKEFFVYSYDGELGQVVIGRGHDCRKTRELTRTVRVALDNGQRISCTPDHLFLLKSGKYRMARDLIPGDSLMPMYRRLSQNKRVRDYEEVCSGEDNWLFTHFMADKFNLSQGIYNIESGTIRHHWDFNKYNNCPRNIQRMSFREHYRIHGVCSSERMKKNNPMWNPEIAHKAIRNGRETRVRNGKPAEPMRDLSVVKKFKETNSRQGWPWQGKVRSEKTRNKISESVKKAQKEGRLPDPRSILGKATEASRRKKEAGIPYHRSEESRRQHFERLSQSIQDFWGSPENFERTEKMREGMSTRAKLRVGPLNSFFGKKHSPETRAKMSLAKKGKTWAEIRGQVSNHKVIGIESGKFEDVYCFAVDGYENFAVDVDGGVKQSSGVFVHNCKHVYSLIQALVNSRMLKD